MEELQHNFEGAIVFNNNTIYNRIQYVQRQAHVNRKALASFELLTLYMLSIHAIICIQIVNQITQLNICRLYLCE